MSEDTIQVVYNSDNTLMVVLGDAGVELSRAEAEQLFLDLGHALQELDRLDNQA
jgi:hypothetical protein